MKKDTIPDGACKEIILMMQDVIEGNGTQVEERTVNEHVLHCETCRRVFDDMQLIRRETAALTAEPPCDLKDRILKRVREEERSEAINRVRKSKKRTRSVTGMLAAAAVIALCVFGVGRYVKANDGVNLMGLATMQDKSISSQMYMAEEAEEEAVEADEMEAALAAPEAAGQENVVYDREAILEDAKSILEAYGVKGMYAEVFYANVENLPESEAILNNDPSGAVGIYETEDFAAFVTDHLVTISGVQYEFTNGVEISSCGLEYGGTKVLIILVTR